MPVSTRHYTAGEYFQTTEILRNCFRDPAITTDVIVGFPGETEEEFREKQHPGFTVQPSGSVTAGHFFFRLRQHRTSSAFLRFRKLPLH